MNIDRPRLLRVLVVLLIAALGLVSFTQFVARPWEVAGNSMAPALKPGDRVVLDLLSLRHRRPRIGEVVVFRAPGGNAGEWVKRVAPAPGAQIPARPFLWPPGHSLPSSWLWMEGDRASSSLDSREIGPVPPEQVVGRVAWRYWPLADFGPIPPPPAPKPERRSPKRRSRP